MLQFETTYPTIFEWQNLILMEGKGHKVWWAGRGMSLRRVVERRISMIEKKLTKLSVGRSFTSQHHDVQAKKCERCPDVEIMSFC